MVGSRCQSENTGGKEPEKVPDEKDRVKVAALNYVELSLANPSYGDARRDELALAALAAPHRWAKRRSRTRASSLL